SFIRIICSSDGQSIFDILNVVFCIVYCYRLGRPTITANVLQLPEGGDFEAVHCLPSTNFDRCRKLDLTTEPPLLGRCCYLLAFF
uniref:hypothetical protein n=1 Tax=Riemerella anatipestifer TaxID=34085 RepID=UPI0030BB06DA